MYMIAFCGFEFTYLALPALYLRFYPYNQNYEDKQRWTSRIAFKLVRSFLLWLMLALEQ